MLGLWRDSATRQSNISLMTPMNAHMQHWSQLLNIQPENFNLDFLTKIKRIIRWYTHLQRRAGQTCDPLYYVLSIFELNNCRDLQITNMVFIKMAAFSGLLWSSDGSSRWSDIFLHVHHNGDPHHLHLEVSCWVGRSLGGEVQRIFFLASCNPRAAAGSRVLLLPPDVSSVSSVLND